MYLRLTAFTTAICFGFWSVAVAEVTPEDVWQNWQRVATAYGQTLTADSVVREGDTLLAKGVKVLMDQDALDMSGGLSEMRFRDLGDGTVEVTASDTYKVTVTAREAAKADTKIDATILQPGLRVLASGSPENMAYDYSVPKQSVTMQITENGKAVSDIQADATGVSGRYAVTSLQDATDVVAQLRADAFAMAVNGINGDDRFDLTGAFKTPQFSIDGRFLSEVAMEDPLKALKDGLKINLSLAWDEQQIDALALEKGKSTKISAQMQGGGFGFGLDAAGLSYSSFGKAAKWVVSGDEVPFPEVVVTYDEFDARLAMPVMKSEDLKDFSALTRIVGLNASPEIWGILDPTGLFPHDPVTFVLDTKGKVRLKADILDDTATAALGNESPAELHALTVSELTARAIGAEVTGNSELTFDNSDLTSFDGMPAPTGKINLVIQGANGVLDKLVAVGLVPPEDAMGFRMMMAMLAKPGEGADVLTSTLEFKGKEFYANGQRLK